MKPSALAALSALALFAAPPAVAQQQPAAPPPAAAPVAPLLYGKPISFDAARKAMAAAQEAAKDNRGVATAVVDSGGHLVMMHRLDGRQIASIRFGT